MAIRNWRRPAPTVSTRIPPIFLPGSTSSACAPPEGAAPHRIPPAERGVERNCRTMKCGNTVFGLVLALALGPPAAAQDSPLAPRSPYLGSVSTGTPTSNPISLSVKDAIDQALKHNLGLLLEQEAAETAS